MIHAPGIIAPFNITAAQYRSQVVQEALDKFPNPLADGEAGKIAQIVNLMNASGNWDQVDYKFGWYLTNEANALTSWRGTKTATNVNSSIHTTGQGFLFNGSTQYLNTNITPSTDLTNAVLDDIRIEAYVFDNQDAGSVKYLYGSQTGGVGLFTLYQAFGTSIRGSVNSTAEFADTIDSGLFLDKTRYGLARIDFANMTLSKDGTQIHTQALVSTGLPTTEIFIGANNNGASATGYINAEQSYFLIGGGFDLTALNTELNLEQSLFNLN